MLDLGPFEVGLERARIVVGPRPPPCRRIRRRVAGRVPLTPTQEDFTFAQSIHTAGREPHYIFIQHHKTQSAIPLPRVNPKYSNPLFYKC